MPKGSFEFKYVASNSGYPKNGLIRTSAKNGVTTVTYCRRLTEKEITKYNLTDLNRKVGVLATLREQAGKKQKELAEELGISNKSLQRYEQYGAEAMSLRTAVQIAAYIGCDVSDLAGPSNSEVSEVSEVDRG